MSVSGISEQSPPVITEAVGSKSEEDLARADLYGLIAALMAAPPGRELLNLLGSVDPDDTELGKGLRALLLAANQADPNQVRDEYNDLFIGLGRGELVPHGSFYLTGFLNEKPLAHLRADLQVLGVERAPENAVPEDHIASLCDVMAGIIRGDYVEAGAVCQRTFFERHVAPWAPQFFEDLTQAGTAQFYRAVGQLGQSLVRIDALAFKMAA